jgi:hypothetical protein
MSEIEIFGSAGNDSVEERRQRAREALRDRRQRAREAYYDRYNQGDNIGGAARKGAIAECIETATRVQLSDDIVFADWPTPWFFTEDERKKIIKATFEAAGFEVTE